MGRQPPKGKYTERYLQSRFFHTFVYRKYDLIIPNVIANIGICDLLCIRKSGYTEDVEIKVTHSDFIQEFKHKKNKHLTLRTRSCACNRFWFFCPEGVIDEKEIPKYAGFLVLDKAGKIRVVKEAPLLHKEKHPYLTDPSKICHSLMFKVFKRIEDKDKRCQEHIKKRKNR